MTIRWVPALVAISLVGMAAAPPAQATETTIEQMPPDSSLLYPFIDKQGNAEQSYAIQLIGKAEKAKILTDEKALLDELCAYRDTLCLADEKH